MWSWRVLASFLPGQISPEFICQLLHSLAVQWRIQSQSCILFWRHRKARVLAGARQNRIKNLAKFQKKFRSSTGKALLSNKASRPHLGFDQRPEMDKFAYVGHGGKPSVWDFKNLTVWRTQCRRDFLAHNFQNSRLSSIALSPAYSINQYAYFKRNE